MTQFGDRSAAIRELSKRYRDVPVIVYGTSQRPNADGEVHVNAGRRITAELRQIGVAKELVLFLSTLGGQMPAAWQIINLLRAHCQRLTVAIGGHCLSAGTLMALGADAILMSRDALLSPVDPSFYIKGKTGEVKEVSVEDVASLLQWGQDKAQLKKAGELGQLALRLADEVGPLMIGRVNRTHQQIRSLTSRMLRLHRKVGEDDPAVTQIVTTLCESLYAHDHLIGREEARSIGLDVVPDVPDELETALSNLDEALMEAFQADDPFSARTVLGTQTSVDISLPLAIVETAERAHVFVQEARVTSGPAVTSTMPAGMPMPATPNVNPVLTTYRRRWIIDREPATAVQPARS